jgi:hypothetical protein
VFLDAEQYAQSEIGPARQGAGGPDLIMKSG